MVRCSQCGAICDPADIRQGICDDCEEENKIITKRQEEIRRTLNDSEYQIKMRLEKL